MMIRLLFTIFALLATETFAGYHEAFDQGFDEFAKKQGFDDFADYLTKRDACAILIISVQDKKTKKQDDKVKLLEVSPPEGYHWMTKDGLYSLMKNPETGYGQHPNSSLIANIPLFPNFLLKSVVSTRSAEDKENSLFLEVIPPKGYHWMSSNSSYLLMKNPSSGYAPHSAGVYKSGLKLKFLIYSKNKSKSSVKESYASTNQNKVSEATALIYEWLEKSNKPGLGELFSNIDKDRWLSSNCGFRMFVETNFLTDLLENNLTGSKVDKSNAKMKAPKKDYGYGY